MPTADERETSARPQGATYDHEIDGPRLARQLRVVRDYMLEIAYPAWRTLREIADMTHAPEASVSARLRDLRRPACGGYTVERRRREDGEGGATGIHEYRVLPTPDDVLARLKAGR